MLWARKSLRGIALYKSYYYYYYYFLWFFFFNPKQTLHIRLPLSPVSPVAARLNTLTLSLLPISSGCIAQQPVCLGGAGPAGTRLDCSSSTIQAKPLLGQRLHRRCLRTIHRTTTAMKRQWEIKYEKGQKTDTTAQTLTEHSCTPKQWPYFFFWIWGKAATPTWCVVALPPS